MTAAAKYPLAFARLIKGRTVNQWRVAQCPYCGRPHLHGAGAAGGDPLTFLGHKVAHCIDSDNPGYILAVFGARNK